MNLFGLRTAMMCGWTNPYVTDGLMAMWDGVWNAGGGKHDESITEWVDISGRGNNISLINPTYNNGIIHFTKDSYANGPLSKLPGNVTIEFVYNNIIGDRAEGQTEDTWTGIWIKYGGTKFGVYYIEFNRFHDIGIRADDSYDKRYNFAKYTNNSNGSVTLVADGATKNGYKNGIFVGSSSRNVTTEFTPQYVQIGRQNADQWLTADYCCIRIYNRALSEYEIAKNYAIDKVRFNLP